jgi:hypothetical protein
MSEGTGESLNAGAGSLVPAYFLALVLADDAAALGAGPDFFAGVAAAVHDHNRRAPAGRFLALGLPELAPGTGGLAALGRSVRLFGAGDDLEALCGQGRVAGLARSGMLASTPRVRRVPADWRPCEAFVRRRDGERKTPSRLAREIARNRRQARPAGRLEARLDAVLADAELLARARREHDRDCVFLPTTRPGVRLTIARLRSDESSAVAPGALAVSTYGLSWPSAPAFLPAAA